MKKANGGSATNANGRRQPGHIRSDSEKEPELLNKISPRRQQLTASSSNESPSTPQSTANTSISSTNSNTSSAVGPSGQANASAVQTQQSSQLQASNNNNNGNAVPQKPISAAQQNRMILQEIVSMLSRPVLYNIVKGAASKGVVAINPSSNQQAAGLTPMTTTISEGEIPKYIEGCIEAGLRSMENSSMKDAVQQFRSAEILIDSYMQIDGIVSTDLMLAVVINLGICFYKVGLFDEAYSCFENSDMRLKKKIAQKSQQQQSQQESNNNNNAQQPTHQQYVQLHFEEAPTSPYLVRMAGRLKRKKLRLSLNLQMCILFSEIGKHEDAVDYARNSAKIAIHCILDALCVCYATLLQSNVSTAITAVQNGTTTTSEQNVSLSSLEQKILDRMHFMMMNSTNTQPAGSAAVSASNNSTTSSSCDAAPSRINNNGARVSSATSTKNNNNNNNNNNLKTQNTSSNNNINNGNSQTNQQKKNASNLAVELIRGIFASCTGASTSANSVNSVQVATAELAAKCLPVLHYVTSNFTRMRDSLDGKLAPKFENIMALRSAYEATTATALLVLSDDSFDKKKMQQSQLSQLLAPCSLDMYFMSSSVKDDHWLLTSNILNLLQMKPIQLASIQEKHTAANEVSVDVALKAIVHAAISFYCISTEARFIEEAKFISNPNLTFRVSDSEYWLGKSLEIAYTLIPQDALMISQIVNVFTRFHGIEKQIIPEEEDFPDSIKFLKPQKGVNITGSAVNALRNNFFIPVVRTILPTNNTYSKIYSDVTQSMQTRVDSNTETEGNKDEEEEQGEQEQSIYFEQYEAFEGGSDLSTTAQVTKAQQMTIPDPIIPVIKPVQAAVKQSTKQQLSFPDNQQQQQIQAKKDNSITQNVNVPKQSQPTADQRTTAIPTNSTTITPTTSSTVSKPSAVVITNTINQVEVLNAISTNTSNTQNQTVSATFSGPSQQTLPTTTAIPTTTTTTLSQKAVGELKLEEQYLNQSKYAQINFIGESQTRAKSHSRDKRSTSAAASSNIPPTNSTVTQSQSSNVQQSVSKEQQQQQEVLEKIEALVKRQRPSSSSSSSSSSAAVPNSFSQQPATAAPHSHLTKKQQQQQQLLLQQQQYQSHNTFQASSGAVCLTEPSASSSTSSSTSQQQQPHQNHHHHHHHSTLNSAAAASAAHKAKAASFHMTLQSLTDTPTTPVNLFIQANRNHARTLYQSPPSHSSHSSHANKHPRRTSTNSSNNNNNQQLSSSSANGSHPLIMNPIGLSNGTAQSGTPVVGSGNHNFLKSFNQFLKQNRLNLDNNNNNSNNNNKHNRINLDLKGSGLTVLGSSATTQSTTANSYASIFDQQQLILTPMNSTTNNNNINSSSSNSRQHKAALKQNFFESHRISLPESNLLTRPQSSSSSATAAAASLVNSVPQSTTNTQMLLQQQLMQQQSQQYQGYLPHATTALASTSNSSSEQRQFNFDQIQQNGQINWAAQQQQQQQRQQQQQQQQQQFQQPSSVQAHHGYSKTFDGSLPAAAAGGSRKYSESLHNQQQSQQSQHLPVFSYTSDSVSQQNQSDLGNQLQLQQQQQQQYQQIQFIQPQPQQHPTGNRESSLNHTNKRVNSAEKKVRQSAAAAFGVSPAAGATASMIPSHAANSINNKRNMSLSNNFNGMMSLPITVSTNSNNQTSVQQAVDAQLSQAQYLRQIEQNIDQGRSIKSNSISSANSNNSNPFTGMPSNLKPLQNSNGNSRVNSAHSPPQQSQLMVNAQGKGMQQQQQSQQQSYIQQQILQQQLQMQQLLMADENRQKGQNRSVGKRKGIVNGSSNNGGMNLHLNIEKFNFTVNPRSTSQSTSSKASAASAAVAGMGSSPMNAPISGLAAANMSRQQQQYWLAQQQQQQLMMKPSTPLGGSSGQGGGMKMDMLTSQQIVLNAIQNGEQAQQRKRRVKTEHSEFSEEGRVRSSLDRPGSSISGGNSTNAAAVRFNTLL